MQPYFQYMLQVNVALLLFFLLYRAVLKRDTFLQLRRFFFLALILFSLVYPVISIPLPAYFPSPFKDKTVETRVEAVAFGRYAFGWVVSNC